MMNQKYFELHRIIQENGREAYERTLSEEALEWLEQIEEQTGKDLFEHYIDNDGTQTPEQQVSQIAVIVLNSGKNESHTDEELQEMIEKAEGNQEENSATKDEKENTEEDTEENNNEIEDFRVQRIGSLNEKVEVLETKVIEVHNQKVVLPSKIKTELARIGTAEINYNSWEKYGKARIYFDIDTGQKQYEGYYGIDEENGLSSLASKVSWLMVEIWKQRKVIS